MNCHLSRLLLAFPAADLSAEDRAGLNAHVAGCPHCSQLAANEAVLHRTFSNAMRAVPVPADLHAKLLRSGFAQRGAKLRKDIYRWSALAAAVLLAVGVAFGGYLHSRPEIDTNALAIKADQNREPSEGPVREWLVKQDLPETLPFDFDYRYYAFHGTCELANRDTPFVLFQGQFTNQFERTETYTALVYIVTSANFKKIDQLRDAQASTVRVVVKYDPAKPNIAYVVVFTSETLDPFLKRARPHGPG